MKVLWLLLASTAIVLATDNNPLYLTPLLEKDQIEDAQRLARVNPSKILNVEAYSGYLTVNKEYNSNLFFIYFPPDHVNPKKPETEFIVWLEGGPGASSLFGVFNENGPVYIENLKDGLKRRTYSWHVDTHVLYIDNPVGSGFSFTDNDLGYTRNSSQIGEQLYIAIKQFCQLFPVVQGKPMFIAGSSYAGKYIPALAQTIHQNNQIVPESEKLNLQGLMIGNGFVDPINQMVYGDLLYQIGLIDDNELVHFHQEEEKGRKLIENKQWLQALKLYDNLLTGNKSYFYNTTGYTYLFNFMSDKSLENNVWIDYVQTPAVRKALHVGDNPFVLFGDKVNQYLAEDILQSMAPVLEKLLSHMRVILYWGQLDINVQYRSSLNYVKKLKFPGAKEYKTAKRCKWMVLSNLGGYCKRAGNLTEVMVREAGHLVGVDKTWWHMDILHKFINKKSFCVLAY